MAAVAAIGSFVPAAHAERDVPVEDQKTPAEGLDDVALGPVDAKVVIVEYASLTCGHCGRFHREVFPELKKKYIDTGKIRFIMREFPLDNLAAAAAMLARCVDKSKTYDLLDVLFEKQADWAYAQGNPVPKLFEIAKQAGFTQESFEKCLTDQPLLDKINAQRSRGSEQFGVSATPTFFINGKRLTAGPSMEAFSAAIDPQLGEDKK
ncbi:MAG: DsbA family protein [Hyphomicrobiaceae bacterium]